MELKRVVRESWTIDVSGLAWTIARRRRWRLPTMQGSRRVRIAQLFGITE